MTDLQRQRTARLETWMRAACMWSGPIGANRYRSKLHMTWVAHRTVLDRSMSRWAARRLAPFLTTPAVAPPLASSAINVARRGRRHDSPASGRWWRCLGGVPYEGRETRVFSPLEHERIRLACGLDLANYDAGRPPIYAVFLAEGRSMVKVEAVLQKILAPTPDDWDPIRLYVSKELVCDMKDLKLGWGNENAHDTMPPRNLPLCRPPSVDGSADEAPQGSRAGRSSNVSVDGRHPGIGSRTGLLPRILLRDADIVEEVHLPPHCALRSRVLPPHRGAGHLPSVGRKGRGLRDHVSRIDRRDLVASFCGRQGVFQPPGSRPARVPIIFAQARHSRLLPAFLSIAQWPCC